MSTQERMERIQKILDAANDPFFPAGQAAAGLQLARVEVPWLLEQLAALSQPEIITENVVSLEDYRASRQESVQKLAVGS